MPHLHPTPTTLSQAVRLVLVMLLMEMMRVPC